MRSILIVFTISFMIKAGFAQSFFRQPDVRRYFDKGFNHYRLAQFYARPGKSDSVGMVTSIPGCSYFTEPIEKDGWMFSITRDDKTNKKGLIAWESHGWMIRPIEPLYDSIWVSPSKVPVFYGKKSGKLSKITLIARPDHRELIVQQMP